MKPIVIISAFVLLVIRSPFSFGYTGSDNQGPNIAKRAESLLANRKFDELEKLAAEYRHDIVKTKGGVPALYFFYPGLSSNTSKDMFKATIADKPREALLEDWLKKKPDSVTARIALCDYWMKLAWEARGGGFANTVTADRWKAFHALVSKAASFIREIDTTTDPVAYYQQIETARDSSAPRKRLDSLYLNAISKFPSYYEFYIQRAILLQEKWQGAHGEFAAYANSLPKIEDHETGLIAYSFVVVSTINSCDCNGNEIFRSIGLLWEPTKQGFYARLKKYGLRNRDWNQLALLAALAGQPTESKAAMQHIVEWDPPVWKSKENYDRAVEWVRTTTTLPTAGSQLGGSK